MARQPIDKPGKSSQKVVREYLRGLPDGATAGEIAVGLNAWQENVNAACIAMADVYIDRWTFAGNGHTVPVYIAVHVPEDAPKPEKKND